MNEVKASCTSRVERVVMWPIFKLILEPLILRDYRKRAYGLKPDEWHWADKLAAKYGYFAKPPADQVYCLYAKRAMEYQKINKDT